MKTRAAGSADLDRRGADEYTLRRVSSQYLCCHAGGPSGLVLGTVLGHGGLGEREERGTPARSSDLQFWRCHPIELLISTRVLHMSSLEKGLPHPLLPR